MSETPKNSTVLLDFTIAKAINLNLRQLDEITEIQRICQLSRWSKEDYQIESERQNSIFLIAETNGTSAREIIGFILLRINSSDASDQMTGEHFPDADLLNFGVTNRFQNLGIGRALFNEAYFTLGKSGISAVWLEVRESNFTAIKFYESRHFITVQKRRNFYSQPLEDALLMKLSIEPFDQLNVG